MNNSGFLLPVEQWNQLNVGPFLLPGINKFVNPRPFNCVGKVLPETYSVDRLAQVVELFVHSAHQRQHNALLRSMELPDPTVDLEIYTLSDQVRDQDLLNQHPNDFLQSSELSLFNTATDFFDDD